MFRVDRYGHLEHIHYGNRVRMEDRDALSYKKCISHGTTVSYDKEDNVFTMDSLPQEYATYGTGDLNEASIEIDTGSSCNLDLLYGSYEIKEGDMKIDGLPSSYGANKTLILHLKDPVNGCEVDLYYAIYYEEDVLSRRAVFFNRTKGDITLHKMMSYCMDLMEEDLVLMDLRGAWDREAHLNERPVQQGSMTLCSRNGFSSAKNNPGFILRKKDCTEEQGKAWGFNLVYSGNHYSSISKNEYGFVRVQGGLSNERFHKVLKPGTCFETPEAVMTCSSKGLNLLSQNFHDFINKHIVRSNWKGKQRPVLINSWEGFGFDFKKEDLINKLAKNAKDVGIELFVLDDGWFGRRNSDHSGLGDYDCNTDKIPGGISSLSKEIHDLGMLFGIWIEPEAINIDSALYEKHSEFVMKEEGRQFFFGRNELLMDLTRKDVRDYIVENVSRLIDENDIDYIKWDMNRHMNGVDGVYDHEYIKGLYEVLERIFTPRPDVLFESCASGGNRFDLGMLCYSPQIWASDDTDPIERIDIQKSLSYLYPLSTMGAHVSASPHSQTLRTTPLETRFAVSAYGCLGYELDLSLLSSAEKEEIASQIDYYKKHRETFQYGRFYRFNTKEGYETFEVLSEKEAIISHFRKQLHAVPAFEKLYAHGLKEETIYSISSRPYIHDLKKYRLHYKKKTVLSNQEYFASGQALKQGICLDPLYLGTGYNENVRIPLDNGSDMCEIKEKK